MWLFAIYKQKQKTRSKTTSERFPSILKHVVCHFVFSFRFRAVSMHSHCVNLTHWVKSKCCVNLTHWGQTKCCVNLTHWGQSKCCVNQGHWGCVNVLRQPRSWSSASLALRLFCVSSASLSLRQCAASTSSANPATLLRQCQDAASTKIIGAASMCCVNQGHRGCVSLPAPMSHSAAEWAKPSRSAAELRSKAGTAC